MEIIAILAVLALLVVGTLISVVRGARPKRGRRGRYVPLPALIIPTSPGAATLVPAGVARAKETIPRAPISPEPASREPFPVPVAAQPAMATTAPTAAQTAVAGKQRRTQKSVGQVKQSTQSDRERELEKWMEPSSRQRRPANQSYEESPDATVAFRRPVEDPVQVLPGRLHILSGDAAGRDLQLFSKAGERPRIVVGRDAGPAHRHITLRSPTVSRRHARMEFMDGQWTITNLSETNPVLVNDRALANGSSARKLSNGDRIELGEIALRFLAS